MQSPIETSLQSFCNTIAAEFTNALGSIQHFFQEPQNAIESYNQALRLNPESIPAYYGRGVVRQSQRDHLGAIADFTKVIELSPTHTDGYLYRAHSRGYLGDNAGAIADYEQVKRLSPENEWMHYGLGCARWGLGDIEGATQDFERYANHYPSGSAYYNLAISQQLLGMNSRALESLHASLGWKGEQEAVAIYYARSVARRALDDEQGAQSDFEYATSLETAGSGSLQSNDEHAYYYRGVARHYMGNPEEAIGDLQRSVELAQRKGNTAFHDQVLELIAEW
jgi:tetratricopeptide (TPR) repeat protein